MSFPSDLEAAVSGWDAYTAKLTMAVSEFDAASEWDADGSVSVVAWLRARGLTFRDAAELAKIGGKLRRLPLVAEAWLRGELTSGQVKVICAQVIERHVGLFAQHSCALVPSLAGLTVDETLFAIQAWRARADALDDGPEPRDEKCEAFLSPTLDDRGVLNATFDAEGHALAQAALELADSRDLDVPAPQRRGQALKDVFRFFLDNQNKHTGGRNRPHLNLIVEAGTLGTAHPVGRVAATGQMLDSATLQRLMCDCDMHRVLDSAGAVLDYGREMRHPSQELYSAVVARDHRCRWKACDRPASWCHTHHVEWWDRDFGPTSIDNLVLLCSRHHHMLHRRNWRARLRPDGEFTVTTPWGKTWTTHPPGAARPPNLDWPGADDDWTFDDYFAQHVAIRARVQELKDLARARDLAHA